ncbi:MAG: hypothetical protein QM770_16385 [Tepidisphaeraceae bacterium]
MASPVDRYVDLIRHTLEAAVANRPPVASRPGEVSMETGLSFVRHVLSGQPMTEPSSLNANLRVVDGAGHSRSMYRGLLRYVLNRSDLSTPSPLRQRTRLPASESRDIVGELWLALANHDDESIAHFIDHQQPTGEWFARTSSDNPEPVWYHELVALHAVASHFHEMHDPTTHQAMLKSARYIAAEVQPDHASSQPWGIHALLQVPDGIHLADMMLHAAGVQQPATMDAVSLILLADAYLCLRPPV